MVQVGYRAKACGAAVVMALLFALPVTAQTAAKPAAGKGAVSNKQPIQISSDKLDVLQAEHKAIFSGNVVAVQGTTTMRSVEMVVYYADSDAEAPAGAGDAQGITRIDAMGNVVFTTPEETAQGDKAVYEVATNVITLTGPGVTLTREKNVLKGTHLTYDMDTGRSVLTGGGVVSDSGKPTRVQGLFVPKDDAKDGKKADGKKVGGAP